MTDGWLGRRGVRLRAFLSEYTAGLSQRDVRRLFDHDAARAYAVLTRDQAGRPEPRRGLRRVVHRARLTFLGLSYKLTPPRRLLFAAALLFTVIGLLDFRYRSQLGAVQVSIDFSPVWSLASVGSLVFLLALELVDRVRVRDELEVARELQADLLPEGTPELHGWRFAHSYRTANEVGGDYYDLTPLADGRLALMVADASGHGMAAGLVMAIANATLKTALDLDPAPRRVMALLNRTLCRTGTRRTFLSAFYALLDPATGALEHVGAGHPYPLLRRADGTVEELGSGGLPLGIREPLEPVIASSRVPPGGLLVLFTDGLVEAVAPGTGEAFGFARLTALVRQGGAPQELHDRILAAFDRHVGGEPLLDDLTLLVVARDDPEGPTPTTTATAAAPAPA